MRKIRAFIIFLLSISILTYIFYQGYAAFSDFERSRLLVEKRKIVFRNLEREIKKEITNFPGEAGVIVKDLDKGWEIRVGGDKKFPSASLVKVPIMASCLYAANEKKVNLDEMVYLKTTNKVSGSGVLKSMPAGKKFTVEELIEIMITESDNTATNMLVDRLGFEYFNRIFKKLGLKDTNINRKMMDFRSRRRGIENFTSTNDLESLLHRIYKGTLIDKNTSSRCLTFLKKQRTRDRIPARLPKDMVIAHKTGLEKGVCHDVGIVFAPGCDFLICVFTKHNGKNSIKAKRFIAQVSYLSYEYSKWCLAAKKFEAKKNSSHIFKFINKKSCNLN